MYADGKLKPHDTIYKFDPKGNVVKSFGAQMFIWPHGLHVDREGNVWATDAASEDAVATAAKAGVKAGHIVRKFSPDGQVLMTLGEPGVAGNDEHHFSSPAGVVTAPNGDIFVADGHGSNNRVVKYSKDGKFIKAWGRTGYAPGEFRIVHCIAMDKRGRLFVCDRSNARIQIFDQDGKYLARWHQFGMPSGIAFSVNDEDLIYVFDSESDNVDNPGFEQGIRIGDALNGWVRHFILDQGGNPGTITGSGPEFGAVDKFGNVFAGEPRPRILRKYVKVR
jgi:sugar lactone lactonase YvrE